MTGTNKAFILIIIAVMDLGAPLDFEKNALLNPLSARF